MTYARGLDVLGAISKTAEPDTAFSKVESEVVTVHKRVSPWLWIVSLCSFALGIWSKVEITKMYGDWRRGFLGLKRELKVVKAEVAE